MNHLLEVHESMEKYYIKKGNKYIQVGYGCKCNGALYEDIPRLYNGLWYIEGGSQTNIIYRVAELSQPVDIANYIKVIPLQDSIIYALKKIDKKMVTSGMSLNDQANIIINQIFQDLQQWEADGKRPEHYSYNNEPDENAVNM